MKLPTCERLAALSFVSLTLGFMTSLTHAQNAYLDVNGTTAGYGIVNGGSYSWEDPNWATVVGGTNPTANWVPGSFARFLGGVSGNSYTVTLNSSQQTIGWIMNINGVTLNINAAEGGALEMVGGVIQNVFAGANATINLNAPITGSAGLAPQNGGSMAFNAVNTYTGGTSLVSSSTLVFFNNGSAFGSGDIGINLNSGTSFVPFLGAGGAPITLPNNWTVGIHNTGINFAASPDTPVTCSGTLALSVNTLRLRNNGNATSPVTFSNMITGSGGITLSANNSGTIIFSGPNSYSGVTTVSVGNTAATLKLGAANTIASSTQVLMSGGILNPGGLNHAMTGTTLGLGGTANSTIDYADGPSEIAFANSSAEAWTPGRTLDLANWNPPATKLRIGTDATGLTPAQLAQISANGGGAGTATLDAGGYIVFPSGGPTITQEPQSPPTLCANTPFTLTVSATGTGTLTYKWYRNNVLMPGETGSSLMLTAGSANAQNGDQYHVVVTDNNGSTTSADATLTIYDGPTFSLHPYNASVVPGSIVSFTVAAESHTTPTTLTYQWYLAPSTPLSDGQMPSGTVISGATTPTLTLTNVQADEAGSYFATVTDACGVSASSVAGIATVVPLLCAAPFPDLDANGLLDLNDFGLFQICYTGSAASFDPINCACVDQDGNQVVDGADFAAFTACVPVAGHPLPVDDDCGGTTVMFSQDFETDDAANWTVLKSTGLNANDSGSSADFFFDYGALGIPSAPHSAGGTTHGMKLQANLTGNVFSGLSVSPTGRTFTGSYTLEFDMWLSYTGALDAGSFAAAFNTNYGILSDGTTVQWVGQEVTSIMFSSTNNGASAADYRVFSPASSSSGGYQDPFPNPSPVYAANYRANGLQIRDSAHPYYSFLGGAAAPAAQLALYPSLTGTTPAGSAGFAWRHVKIVKNANYVLWYIDDHLMATLDLFQEGETSGTNILFGQGDPDAASPTDPNAAALDFALFDNVRVTRN